MNWFGLRLVQAKYGNTTNILCHWDGLFYSGLKASQLSGHVCGTAVTLIFNFLDHYFTFCWFCNYFICNQLFPHCILTIVSSLHSYNQLFPRCVLGKPEHTTEKDSQRKYQSSSLEVYHRQIKLLYSGAQNLNTSFDYFTIISPVNHQWSPFKNA